MNKLNRMWEGHLEILAISFPSLHHLKQDDRDSLELLDFYLVDCLETFITNKGDLNPGDIVLFYISKRSLAAIFKKLDGVIDSNGYFEQLLMMSKEALRRVNVKKARLIVARSAECECEESFSHRKDSLFQARRQTVVSSSVMVLRTQEQS